MQLRRLHASAARGISKTPLFSDPRLYRRLAGRARYRAVLASRIASGATEADSAEGRRAGTKLAVYDVRLQTSGADAAHSQALQIALAPGDPHRFIELRPVRTVRTVQTRLLVPKEADYASCRKTGPDLSMY